MCMGVYLHVYLCTVDAMSTEPKEGIDFPGTRVVCHPVGTRNQTPILWKNSQCS